jgi:uncharacterized membrane protein YqiK
VREIPVVAVWVGALFVLLLLVAFRRYVLMLFGIVMVPDDSLGLVTKRFVLFGSNRQLPPGRIIALNGEAGFQADTLSPGLHMGLWPWQYRVSLIKFAEIPQGKVGVIEAIDGLPLSGGSVVGRAIDCDGFQDARKFFAEGGQRGPQAQMIPPGRYRINTLLFKLQMTDALIVQQGKLAVVTARDGASLPRGRILAKHVDCSLFQDAKAFIEKGGQRGPQATVIPPGTYFINPYLFGTQTCDVVTIAAGQCGIVTTFEGSPLPTGEIAGPSVDGHESFQNAQVFTEKGGSKGLQEQVLLSGRYYINPLFAQVESVVLTEVPIAHVGVVISYVGKEGKDVTGAAFQHGNLVSRCEKGVWNEPLDPGRYPINPRAQTVVMVPTANVVLNWATGKTEAHQLDKNLSTITVRSSDGFKFNLDVSQIIHIPRNDAPKVIARFGDMAALVTQVLEPTIGNYFRNAAQSSDVIDFLKSRTQRQAEAREAISRALTDYNVGAVDTLIGDIVPPDALMDTLTARKIADQEKVTFETQRQAQTVRQQLAQAQALADTQPQVVTAERQVSIADFTAQATVKKAEGEAKSRIINAEAEATATKVTGEATGAKTLAIGQAEAEVIKLKINSMESGNYALVQVAQALATSGQRLVPEIVAGGGGSGAESGLVGPLLANLIKASMDSAHTGR